MVIIKNYFQTSYRWLLENISEFCRVAQTNSRKSGLRIIEQAKTGETDDPVFTVQIAGKNIFPKISAKKLAEEKGILANFSQDDQTTILNAIILSNKNLKSCRILAKTFDRKIKQFIFTIEQNIGGVSIKRNLYAEELLKQGLSNFNNEDILQIGIEIGKQLN